MRKSELALGAFLVMLVCGASVFILHSTRRDQAIAANADIYKQLDLFGEVLERVRSEYVEKPDDTKLIENAINGMLQGLDPHSSYLTPKEFQDMQVQTRGEFGGLGIEVTMEDGVVKVIAPIDNTPARSAGVMAGDYITHLDGESIQGLTLNEAVEKMRGPVIRRLRSPSSGRAFPLQSKRRLCAISFVSIPSNIAPRTMLAGSRSRRSRANTLMNT